MPVGRRMGDGAGRKWDSGGREGRKGVEERESRVGGREGEVGGETVGQRVSPATNPSSRVFLSPKPVS